MSARMDNVARKRQVLETALRIVDTEGIHSLTLRKIAENVGITEAALFRHFKGKEDIVSSMANTVFEENQYVPRGEGPLQTLENMLTWQLEKFQNNPHHTSVLFQEDIFREYPSTRERFDLRRTSRSTLIHQLIKEGKRLGEFAPDVDEEAFTLLYMGSIRMAVLEWRHSGFSYDLRSRSPPVLGMLRKCLGVSS